MNIELWTNFSKKKNSTKQPTAGSGTTKSVYWKENTSIENPVLILSEPATQYCYCSAFGNYYFVDDVINLDANRSELHCTMDALATNKTAIGSYTAFVERAASSYDQMVNDEFLSIQQDITDEDTAVAAITGLSTSGCYVFRTMANTGIHTYATTDLSVVGNLFTNMLTQSGSTIQDIWNAIASIGMQVLDVSSYINSLMWVPFSASALGGAASNIDAQWWSFSGGGNTYEITNPTLRFTGDLPVPTNAYTDFRKHSSNFSKYLYRLPGVGVVPINTMDAAEEDLKYIMFVDIQTGAVTYEIQHANGELVASFSGQIGVAIPYGSTHFNSSGIFQTMAGMAVGVASGGTSYAAADAVQIGISAASAILEPQTSFSGGTGNRAVLANVVAINGTCINYGSKEFPTTVAGRPLYQNVQISTLSGYIKCGGASIDSIAFGNEKSVIDAYLNNGFYYE